MPIQAGTRLGPYEVVAQIGAGGMGEVYRARDSRLQRDVAVKVLPQSVARDPDQRARFEREAQAVAALSHPNVLAIFDTGSHEGQLYAVTELLEGETLRDRLKHGAIPARKAIDWAVQIARGLSAAHDKHLIHRDLKPENIFLLSDGRVKILDFGLARHTQEAAGGSATETVAAVTGAGIVMGTVGYMSPEQVRGHATDARADLFAFGAVLYEMLSGQRAFRRDTHAETMTAILREDPPELSANRADLPPALERIVRHCLEKNPHERFQSAHDVAFALETLSGSGPAAGSGSAATTTAAPAGTRLRLVLIGVVVVLVVVVGWFGVLKWGSSSDGQSDSAPPIAVGAATQVTADDGLEIDPALSPDGKLLAYAAGRATGMRIFIRPMAGGRTLTLSESGAAFEYRPRWSPDGNQILFLTPDGGFVASLLGGTSQRVAAGSLGSAAWSPDGKHVVLARTTGLSVVALDGRGERQLASGPGELHSCDWSPRNDWIVCTSGNLSSTVPGPTFGNIAPSAIVMASVTDGRFVNVTDRTSSNLSPAWSPDGRHLYFVSNREGPRDIYVTEVSSEGVLGAPRRVTTGLGVQSIAFSGTGQRLVYVAYTARANIWSLPIPSGAAIDASRAQALTSTNQVVESMRVSRDGQWLVFDSTLHLNAELFKMPVAGGPPERLTTDPADDFAPDLSPDGRVIVYHSWRSGSRDIYTRTVDGGPVQTLTSTPAQEAYPIWSPDGNAIAFSDLALGTGVGPRLFVMRRDSTGAWSAPVRIRDNVGAIGSWLSDQELAYPRNGAIEAIPAAPGASRVIYAPANPSDPQARSVIASSDGRALYFKSLDAEGRATIWSVPAAGGKPRLLVRFTDPSRPSIRSDFAAGAGRLFFTLEDRQADIWVAEITRR